MKANRNINNLCWSIGVAGLILWLGILVLVVGPVSAHRVTVFAWVEGDLVHVEGKFAGGKRVKEGKVTVFDLQGNPLLEGRTNGMGKFSFKAPKKRPLKIALDAGMGHRAQWTLDSEDMQQTPLERDETVAAREPDTAPDIIQLAVETALDKKLRPIIKMLGESQNREISLRDILGGLGYILGLMGIAAYFHYRRRSVDGKRGKD